MALQTTQRRPATRTEAPGRLPFVSIQISVYNEQYVISRLLQSLSEIDYPKDCFEIQVLDDSTDESCAIIDAGLGLLRKALQFLFCAERTVPVLRQVRCRKGCPFARASSLPFLMPTLHHSRFF